VIDRIRAYRPRFCDLFIRRSGFLPQERKEHFPGTAYLSRSPANSSSRSISTSGV
jgi:hypothetical protein